MDIQTRITEIEARIDEINNTLDCHDWKPYGHVVEVRVVAPVDKKITVDELGSSFTHRIYENMPVSNGLSLAAK